MKPRKHNSNAPTEVQRSEYNISAMSEEEIQQMMDSIDSLSEDSGSDCGDFDDDDSVRDPDFRLSQEEEDEIDREGHLGRDFFSDTTNLSINLSNPSLPIAESSPPSPGPGQQYEPLFPEEQAGPSQAGSSSMPPPGPVYLTSKPAKRARSPLPQFDETIAQTPANCGNFFGNSADIDVKSTEFTKILWKKKSLQLHRNDVVFRGNSQLPERFQQLKTPYSCFSYLFPDEIFERVATETVNNARQQNNTDFTVSSVDIKKYVGILIYMSIYRYPSLETYWGQHTFEAIRVTMSSKRFYEIRRYLCLNDATYMKKKGEEGYDPLFKIRPVVDTLNRTFDSIPKLPRLCVDEQMCATKMKSRFRQYMPNKPHKWGIKLFVLCDSSGFSYKFEVYHGAGDNVVLPDTPNLGACANVVVRLSQTVPDFKYHIIYFDNFYTSLPLLVYLRSRGIYSLGTIRSNRINNCKLPGDKDKDLMKKPRGHAVEYVGDAYGIDISTVLWKDTKNVRLASTYAGNLPFKSAEDVQPSKLTRYDRTKHQYLEVDCPNVIREYNYHMGGVDLMDGLLGRFHIRLKTKSYSLRLFYHMIDMAVVNAYLLHRRIHAQPKYIELAVFRSEIADVLCRYQQKNPVGRPSQVVKDSEVASSITQKKTYLPPADIRFDKIDHWPEFLDRGGKKTCKLPACKSETQGFCSKCKVNLCLAPGKRCFRMFHDALP